MKKLISLTTAVLLMAGAAAADVIWSEGFNSDFGGITGWGAQFGTTGPGITTNDGAVASIEGDAFAALNRSGDGTGTPGLIGAHDVVLEAVTAADLTYTFTGDFGWRYGQAASEKYVHSPQSGFFLDGTGVSPLAASYVFGDNPAADSTTGLTELTFSYTTTADDIGKDIEFRIRLADRNTTTGLTQLLTDDWQVTVIPEPATLGMLGVASMLVLVLRRLSNR